MPTPPVTPTGPADPTSLAPGDYTSTVILNRIFSLILTMITALQDATAAQANRLTFLGTWQNSYTQLNAEIPTFTQTSGSSFPGNMNTSQRGQLNQLNTTLSTTVQNRQSVVSDAAKALQSNVNQSNDAVNSQSTLGTSILQELSTLLSSIFKG